MGSNTHIRLLDPWQLTSCAAIKVEIVNVAERQHNANVSVRVWRFQMLSASKASDRRLLVTLIVPVKSSNFATIP